MLYDCLSVIDAALYDDDGRVRFDAANRLLIHLWPYLKELRDKIAKEAATESELAEKLDKTLAEEIASLGAVPSGKGKPVPGKREKTLTPEELEELCKTAREVLAEEGGRIALTETESISTGEGGIVTVDHAYAGAGYDKAAADIERVLGKLAETRVCAEAEADLAHELQDFSDHIRYGDAHKGVNIEIDRMAKVPEKLVEQYDRVAPPLLKISRRLQKQVHQVLQDQRRGGRETGLLMGRRLLTRTLYHADGRYFYKNRLPQELPELAVALLVDESGSMSCADRITKARAASIIVYDFCRCLGIPILVLGHITMLDYSGGTGDSEITARANLSPDTVLYLFEHIRTNEMWFNYTEDKIFGEPDADGRMQVTKFRVAHGDPSKRKLPWYIEIANGTGIGQKNKVGGTYMQAGSFAELSKVFINLSDKDIFLLFSRTARYIAAWEAAVCPALVSRGHKAIQANIQRRLKGAVHGQ